MSLALARNGIRHRVIAAASVRTEIDSQHMAELGRRYVDDHAKVIVASVQTIVNHAEPWMQGVGLWVCDEAHHLLIDNIWGRAVALFPNARGLGVTATPMRADRKGLGRHADGVFDAMVVGPSMRELISAGYLSDYRIFCPKSDLDLSGVGVGASGDYVGAQLRAAVHNSGMTGDLVRDYLRLAPGKLGLTFTVDVESAEQTALAYRAAGVKAEVLTGKTPTAWRARVMRAFRAREILQIVNCDLLGEGTDVPGIEVVSFGRPSESFVVYSQQFGRGLRPLEGKDRLIVIDNAGNVIKHGLPDAAREWSLDRREARARSKVGEIPLTSCGECAAVYERVEPCCPYCGFKAEPAGRSAAHFVDGDLFELDEATLAILRGELARVDGAFFPPNGMSTIAAMGGRKIWAARQEAQTALRESLKIYGGWRTREGDSISKSQKRFYLTFGLDVMAAQTLGAREALDLKARVDQMIAGIPIAQAREPESEGERLREAFEALGGDGVWVSDICAVTGLSSQTAGSHCPDGIVTRYETGGPGANPERATGRWWLSETLKQFEKNVDALYAERTQFTNGDYAEALGVRRAIAQLRPGWRRGRFGGGTDRSVLVKDGHEFISTEGAAVKAACETLVVPIDPERVAEITGLGRATISKYIPAHLVPAQKRVQVEGKKTAKNVWIYKNPNDAKTRPTIDDSVSRPAC